MKFSWKRYTIGALLLACQALALIGCGGGGSSAGSTPSTFTISGKVTQNGAGLAGATVTITGAGTATLTTDANGAYSATGMPAGSYTVTPSRSGFTFAPLSQAITITNGNIAVPDFTATGAAGTHTVSGRITLNGAGLSGVTVSIAGTGTGSLITDSAGNYSFAGVLNGDYTITPTRSGFAFDPVSSSFSVNDADVTGRDFIATQTNTGTITITF